MDRSSRSGPFPDAIFTIPCDHARATNQTPAPASSNGLLQEPSSPGMSPPTQNGLDISLESLKDIWTTVSDPAPNSVPASPALGAFTAGADADMEDNDEDEPSDKEDSDQDKPSVVLPSSYFDAAFGPRHKKPLPKKARNGLQKETANAQTSANPRRTGEVQSTIYSADPMNTQTVRHPESTDSGRVKGLLKASGLSVRTQGLRISSPIPLLWGSGSDDGHVEDAQTDTDSLGGVWVREETSAKRPRWVWERD